MERRASYRSLNFKDMVRTVIDLLFLVKLLFFSRLYTSLAFVVDWGHGVKAF